MAAIARSQGCASIKALLTEQATAGAFIDEMLVLARELQPGDFLFLSYSGHGGQVPDLDGDEENDGLDETWCLYDRMLIDDELFKLFSHFVAGVRIFMLSDSCHSGSVARNIMVRSSISFDDLPQAVRSADEALVPNGASLVGFDRIRLAPPDKTLAAYMKNESMYRSLQAAASGAARPSNMSGTTVPLMATTEASTVASSSTWSVGRPPTSSVSATSRRPFASRSPLRSEPRHAADRVCCVGIGGMATLGGTIRVLAEERVLGENAAALVGHFDRIDAGLLAVGEQLYTAAQSASAV
jgi:hypothetical protein